MKDNINICVTSKKIALIPFRETFASYYLEWMKDPYVREMTGSEDLELGSLQQAEQHQQSVLDDPNNCTFLIAAKIGPNQLKLIGDVNFFLQNSDQDEQGIQAEVNIMIGDPSARGKGFAKEALLVGLRYAIEQLHVKQFLAKISDINTSSIALFQKSLQWPITAHSDVFSETTFQLNVSTDIASQLVSSTTDYQILKYEDIHMQVIQPQ